MIDRREFIVGSMLATASLSFGKLLNPIIKKNNFITKPICLGYYLDQPTLKPEYSYFQRQSKVYLDKEYAGFFSYNTQKPRAWGEMIVTERHLRYYPQKTCSSACECRNLLCATDEFQVVHFDPIWTENTKFLPTIPYNWREQPEFKYKHPCSFCGSDEAFVFQHDDAKYFPAGFYCSDCNNKIVKPLLADDLKNVLVNAGILKRQKHDSSRIRSQKINSST